MHDTRRRAERRGCQGYAYLLAGLFLAVMLVAWVLEWAAEWIGNNTGWF